MEIKSITSENLHELIPLLSESAGFAVGFDDELECLQTGGGFGWLQSDESGHPLSFLRCYPISSDVRLIEFYPRDINGMVGLIEKLVQEARRYPGQSFRIDLGESQIEEAQTLQAAGFKRIKDFLHYHIDIDSDFVAADLKVEQARLEDEPYIRELLDELHRYSPQEVNNGIGQNKFWVVRALESDHPMGVAKVLGPAESTNTCELVEFSVDPTRRAKGIGTQFLKALMNAFRSQYGVQTWHL